MSFPQRAPVIVKKEPRLPEREGAVFLCAIFAGVGAASGILGRKRGLCAEIIPVVFDNRQSFQQCVENSVENFFEGSFACFGLFYGFADITTCLLTGFLGKISFFSTCFAKIVENFSTRQGPAFYYAEYQRRGGGGTGKEQGKQFLWTGRGAGRARDAFVLTDRAQRISCTACRSGAGCIASVVALPVSPWQVSHRSTSARTLFVMVRSAAAVCPCRAVFAHMLKRLRHLPRTATASVRRALDGWEKNSGAAFCCALAGLK